MDLKTKGKTIKFFKENKGENLPALEFDKEVLDMTPKAQEIKKKIDKLEAIKIGKFYCEKDIFKKMKRKATF